MKALIRNSCRDMSDDACWSIPRHDQGEFGVITAYSYIYMVGFFCNMVYPVRHAPKNKTEPYQSGRYYRFFPLSMISL